MPVWSGIYHVMATPFGDYGALATHALPSLVEAALASGVNGLTVLGIAGEAHRLTDEERRRVVDGVVKEARGRVPVVVGVSASGAHWPWPSQEWRAITAPPAGVRNLDAVVEYYRAVAGAGRLPVVIQDEPVTTQVVMPAPFLARLVAEVPGVEALKLRKRPRSEDHALAQLARAGACDLRRARWRVLLRGALAGRGRRHDRLSLSGGPPRHPRALRGGPTRRRARPLLPLAPAHPIREPAGRRAGDVDRHPQGDPAAARAGCPRPTCGLPLPLSMPRRWPTSTRS